MNTVLVVLIFSLIVLSMTWYITYKRTDNNPCNSTDNLLRANKAIYEISNKSELSKTIQNNTADTGYIKLTSSNLLLPALEIISKQDSTRYFIEMTVSGEENTEDVLKPVLESYNRSFFRVENNDYYSSLTTANKDLYILVLNGNIDVSLNSTVRQTCLRSDSSVLNFLDVGNDLTVSNFMDFGKDEDSKYLPIDLLGTSNKSFEEWKQDIKNDKSFVPMPGMKQYDFNDGSATKNNKFIGTFAEKQWVIEMGLSDSKLGTISRWFRDDCKDDPSIDGVELDTDKCLYELPKPRIGARKYSLINEFNKNEVKDRTFIFDEPRTNTTYKYDMKVLDPVNKDYRSLLAGFN